MLTTLLACIALAEQPTLELKPPLPGYTLAWHDEFSGDTIDDTKWKPWALGPRRDAINVADAGTLDGDGFLHINTRRVEENGQTRYETGGLWTKDLYEPTFGYVEARIKLHTQMGHWAALWLNCSPMGEPVGDPGRGGHPRGIGGRRVRRHRHRGSWT